MADDKTNILVVDDLPEKLMAYQSILEELGQNLVQARSGPDALKEVLRHEFAVILLDVNMPGMDGLETAALIRKRKKSAHTPIIFITAFTDEVRAAQGYAHGAVDFILAPVVPDILRAKVRVFVDLFRMTQQVKRQVEERIALAEEKTKRTAAEESNRRLSFLARTGDVLGHSLDQEVTARDVARLPVPFLADHTVVAIPGRAAGDWQLIEARSTGEETTLEEYTGRDRLPVDLTRLIDEALDGGDAFLPGPPPDVGESDTTVAALPLQARGRTFAVLVLAHEASGRRFARDDLTVAENLASRAAIALDNARLHQEVQQADRQKNEFLAMLAHELRNPLAPIANAVQVMRLRGLDQPELQWGRDVIDRQVKHLSRLVDDLLDISRITRGKIRLQEEPIDLAAVINQAVEASHPFIQSRQHHLEVFLPTEPLWVNGDAARLAQILTNLLNNAAKYTEEGGRIWLSAGREGGAAVIRVRDTGIGIPAELMASVFDLFIQAERSLDRSQGGLGIGLTLARRLVEMHGGSLEALSEGTGRGSEFIVRLPMLARQPAPAPEVANGAQPVQSPGARWRALVVDDNVDAAESLALLLRLNGCEVRVAHDGPEALRVAPALRPDLVVLDIGLPGMDGYEVARRLRAHPATAEAVYVAATGYGEDEARERSRQAGFDHHLLKPVDFAVLREVLAALPPPRHDQVELLQARPLTPP